MNRLTLAAAAMGAAAVGLGAFGAHGLEDRLSADAVQWWETASSYLLIHAVATFVASTRAGATFAGWMWAAGSAVFSGSLYGLALGAPSYLGMVVPIGGVLLLGGWLALGVCAVRDAMPPR